MKKVHRIITLKNAGIRNKTNQMSNNWILLSKKTIKKVFLDGRPVEFNRKLIKKGPNVQLKIDHVLNPTCLVIRQEAQGDHNGHDWQGQKA